MSRVTLDWVQLAAVVGAVQGLILTLVIATRDGNRTANRLLAAFVAAATVYLAAGPYYRAGIVRLYPHFLGVNYPTTWLFGPLVYLYARAASDKSWRLRRKDLLHFVPAAVTVLAALPVYLMSGREKIATFERWSTDGVDGLLAYLDPFKYASGIGYSAATALFLVRHRRVVEQSYSNTERVNLRWLFWLCSATGSIWLVVTTLKIAQVSSVMRDGPVTIGMAILLYGIGYLGLRQPEIERFERDDPAASAIPHAERARADDAECERLRDALAQIMEVEQPWKESELTLADLARRVDSTPHKLSELLNTQIGTTFYDYVNGYRVREVQRRIRAGDARSLKMLALAMDAGFASKSTFNDVFKKHTTLTPTAFRQTVGA